ncbi:MAG: bifunctional oligoribonuclease/PAP phosphatase NrnA [Actinomycetota bacterium]|nr:bifunctional oligoribonuclease/PAP phosphatase NrnA [Actinomycetota bacterium]
MNKEESNKNNLEFINAIKENKDFLLFTHAYPDGDALGSILAFYKMLKNMNKNVYAICNSEMPYQYKFLSDNKEILKTMDNIDRDIKYVSVFVDCADIQRVLIDYKDILDNSKIIINIDHHLSNTYFGDINIVFPEKSATSEIIYLLIEEYLNEKMDKDIAEALYTGILTDTGKFQYSNTTKDVHKIISRLLEYNINPSEIYSSIYENEPANRFKLLALVLGRTKIFQNNNLIYSFIKMEDFNKLGLPFSANDGIIEILRTAKDVKVAALFKEVKKNNYKVSLRSSDETVNVAAIAEKFGGGGHKMASAYIAAGNLKKAISDLDRAIENNL